MNATELKFQSWLHGKLKMVLHSRVTINYISIEYATSLYIYITGGKKLIQKCGNYTFFLFCYQNIAQIIQPNYKRFLFDYL